MISVFAVPQNSFGCPSSYSPAPAVSCCCPSLVSPALCFKQFYINRSSDDVVGPATGATGTMSFIDSSLTWHPAPVSMINAQLYTFINDS